MMLRKKTNALLVAFVVGVIITGGLFPAESLAEETGGILVTDVGQGNNAKITRMLLKKNGIGDITFAEIATPDDLKGISMMIVGVGASTKGLGAAGLDVDAEAQRASTLLEAAKEAGIETVGVHIGGQARRGEISDKLNEIVMNASDIFIVWSEGNEDGYFTALAEAKTGGDAEAVAQILRVVENKADVGTELKGIIESP